MMEVKIEENDQPLVPVSSNFAPFYLQTDQNHAGLHMLPEEPAQNQPLIQIPQLQSAPYVPFYFSTLDVRDVTMNQPSVNNAKFFTVGATNMPVPPIKIEGALASSQPENPFFILPKRENEAQGTQELSMDELQKRQQYMLRNRIAARRYRQRKKQIQELIENRVIMLEQKNRALMAELRVLKEFYRHKVGGSHTR